MRPNRDIKNLIGITLPFKRYKLNIYLSRSNWKKTPGPLIQRTMLSDPLSMLVVIAQALVSSPNAQWFCSSSLMQTAGGVAVYRISANHTVINTC